MRVRPPERLRLPSMPVTLPSVQLSRTLIERVGISVIGATLLAVAALAGVDPKPENARWVGGPGEGGGANGTNAAAPAPARPAAPRPTGAPIASSPGRNGDNPDTPASPTRPGSPAQRSGSPTQPPSDGPSGANTLESYLARIPQFPPAPPAEKVELPPGPQAGYFSHIPTTQKVAFITMDDGWTQHPMALDLVKAAHVPITMFLTTNAIRANPGWFKQMQARGAVVEAHTLTHAELKGKPYDFQKNEICGSADRLGVLYGRRPHLFRAPFGDNDATTLQAVHDCGMSADFFWKETVDKGVMRFQQGDTVQPGDIVLMHFRPAFPDDFVTTLEQIHRAGLTPALLEDYVN